MLKKNNAGLGPIIAVLAVIVVLIVGNVIKNTIEDRKSANNTSYSEYEENGEYDEQEGDGTVQEEAYGIDNPDGYIIPGSDSSYLSYSDLSGLTLQELNYAKNEIYARHGRRFKSNELQTYFDSKSWYYGEYDPDDFDANYSNSVLNDAEKRNAEIIRDAEYNMSSDGYLLDQ